jgi:allantoicase
MERGFNFDAAAFTGLIDLAAEKVGGKALYCTDDFFAEKENLLKSGRGVFIVDKYTDRGKWMDGWESRRKRVPGYDYCVVKLGIPGLIRGVDIDTNHFLGNHPPYASVDALAYEGNETSEEALQSKNWVEILPKVALKQGSQNIFAVSNDARWTHIRLNIFPDGGVARLKIYGESKPDWKGKKPDQVVDLAAIENGGLVVAANDMFFGNKNNMIMPGRGVNMGDGWETRRRRDPGNDWAIVQLGHPGQLKEVEVDTNHYKGNYPDSCWLEGCHAPGKEIDTLNHAEFTWTEILPQTKLKADHRHFFKDKDLKATGPFSHVKLSIKPDGGISRLRLHGTVSK